MIVSEELIEIGAAAIHGAVASGNKGGVAPNASTLSRLCLEAAAHGLIEKCATMALEQRCERSTAWDAACTTIAESIRSHHT